MLDLHTITATFYTVVKTSGAGAAIRAALGNGANSIVPKKDLALATLPARPFGVFDEGELTGTSLDVRSLFLTWWWYDDPAQGFYRLNTIIPLVEAVYPREDGPITGVVILGAGATRGQYDSALGGLAVRAMR